jgi:hypothetical protein
MKKLEITNVEVDRTDSYQYCLSCETTEACYHVWLNKETRKIQTGDLSRLNKEGTIYKNSHAKRGEPGYFQTRYISAKAIFGAQLFAQMMEAANEQNLFDKAEREFSEREKKVEEDNAKLFHIHCAEKAGPALLEACKAVMRDIDKPWTVVTRAHFSELLQDAIAKADPENHKCENHN